MNTEVSVQHFQKLQELLVITPFTFYETETRKPTDVADCHVVEESPQDADTPLNRWLNYHQYLRTFMSGLQGDEVISVRVIHSTQLEELQRVYYHLLPDAVVVDAPALHLVESLYDGSFTGSVEEKLALEAMLEIPEGEEVLSPLELTRHLRQWSVQEGFRTVILNLTHGEVEQERIQSLVQGADELLDVQMSTEELCIRVLSHIRRHLDQYQSAITRQPNGELLERIFNRRIRQGIGLQLMQNTPYTERQIEASKQHWAIAVFHMDSLNTYGLLYGQEAKLKVIQHCAAVLGQMLHVPDWVFHVEENTFVVLSTPERIERILPIVMKRLDASCGHFLSPDDQNRGFFVWRQEALFTKVPSLRVGAGVMSTNVSMFNYLSPVLAKGLQLAIKALSQIAPPESAWITDCFLLTGEEEDESPEAQAPANPYVMVVEPDAALAFLLEQTISMNGIEVDVMPSVLDLEEAVKKRCPHAIVVDPFIDSSKKAVANAEKSPWQSLQRIRAIAPQTHILATCNHDDYEAALINGSNAFLPKPYKLLPLLSWLDFVLKVRVI